MENLTYTIYHDTLNNINENKQVNKYDLVELIKISTTYESKIKQQERKEKYFINDYQIKDLQELKSDSHIIEFLKENLFAEKYSNKNISTMPTPKEFCLLVDNITKNKESYISDFIDKIKFINTTDLIMVSEKVNQYITFAEFKKILKTKKIAENLQQALIYFIAAKNCDNRTKTLTLKKLIPIILKLNKSDLQNIINISIIEDIFKTIPYNNNKVRQYIDENFTNKLLIDLDVLKIITTNQCCQYNILDNAIKNYLNYTDSKKYRKILDNFIEIFSNTKFFTYIINSFTNQTKQYEKSYISKLYEQICMLNRKNYFLANLQEDIQIKAVQDGIILREDLINIFAVVKLSEKLELDNVLKTNISDYMEYYCNMYNTNQLESKLLELIEILHNKLNKEDFITIFELIFVKLSVNYNIADTLIQLYNSNLKSYVLEIFSQQEIEEYIIEHQKDNNTLINIYCNTQIKNQIQQIKSEEKIKIQEEKLNHFKLQLDNLINNKDNYISIPFVDTVQYNYMVDTLSNIKSLDIKKYYNIINALIIDLRYATDKYQIFNDIINFIQNVKITNNTDTTIE